MMKPVIIIVIIVIVAVGGFILVMGTEQQKNTDFLNALDECSSIMDKWNYNPYAENGLANQHLVVELEKCNENIIQNHLTDEERESYYAEKERQEEMNENSKRTLTQGCREKYIGQLDELNACLDLVDTIYP